MGSAYRVNQYFFFPSRKTFLINEKGILVHIFDEVNLHSHPIDILKVFKDQQ
jgi:peroxiredoxin